MTVSDGSKAVLQRMIEMFATGDLSQVASVVDAGYTDHQESPEADGRKTFSDVVTRARRQFPDLRVQVEDLIAEGDGVVARLRWSGTDLTGGPFQAESIDIIHIADDRAAEHWGLSKGWPQ